MLTADDAGLWRDLAEAAVLEADEHPEDRRWWLEFAYGCAANLLTCRGIDPDEFERTFFAQKRGAV